MIKLGLIGTGKQGERFMQTVLKLENSDVQVTHTCNSKSNYKDLLDSKLDGVIIAADPAQHVEMVRYANIVGTPVLCEKPVGLYLSDVQKLEKCKIPILVNYTHLFSPVFQQVASSIRSPITKIVSIGYNAGPWRRFSSLYDYVPHDLAMCLSLLPGPYEIVSQKASHSNGGVLYKLHLQAGSTEIQILAGNGGTSKRRQLAVFCEDGEQFLYDACAVTDVTAPMTNLVKHFLDVIGGSKPNPPYALTSQIHSILFRLGKNYESEQRT